MQTDFIRLQSQLLDAMQAAPADALSRVDLELLALLEQLEADE